MSEHEMTDLPPWAPEACTLPTDELPLRAAEFDDLFASGVLGVVRESPSRLRLALRAEPDVAARAAHLASRETGCCSFFAFGLEITDGDLALTVSADPVYERVLDAVATRASARLEADA